MGFLTATIIFAMVEFHPRNIGGHKNISLLNISSKISAKMNASFREVFFSINGD